LQCKSYHEACRRRLPQTPQPIRPSPSVSDGEDTDLSSDHCVGQDSTERQLAPELSVAEDLPSRLLEITNVEQQMVRVIETASLSSEDRQDLCSSGFAALSYCWGGEQSQKLISGKLEQFMMSTPARRYSKTIQDALWVTTQLGLRHIWIDALCICQDDETDKQREIAKMSLYYGTASVTICAASATACHEGFLQRREEPAYGTGPFELPYETGGKTGSVILYEDTGSDNPSEPTCSRAWTLQESMLSRRILVFATKQLYWTCCDSNASCGGRNAELTSRIMGDPLSFVPGIYPIATSWMLPPEAQWWQILVDYVSRKMADSSDKLLAISALASHLQQGFAERSGETVYLAGLFLQLERPLSVVQQFLWMTDARRSSRAGKYRAPSWSWACLDGPIETLSKFSELPTESLGVTYYPVPGDPESRRREVYTIKAEVVGHNVTLAELTAPFGAVKAAHLRLRAPMKVISLEDALLRSLAKFVHSLDVLGELDRQLPYLALIPDSVQDEASLERALQGKDPLHCFELLMADSHRLSFGLILDPREDLGLNYFSRLGVYAFSCRDYSIPETEHIMKSRESFHWCAEPTEVCLV